ncbi:pre-rRNA 2'-o-ribose RNA methyltransferase ftsj3 [Anaeramoeba flamelloides]|uniref:Putative rRNA methyltransferase n=1 Tax=Anaeramoeba flamelloides TaxID=1746091 RepID=A0ABQ8X3T6_9EUKA|nr:pre-rRNA 2'-o-ribose RNA methyltransferase ftsj3 [Anaeramoeba flamelloides]
MGRKRKKGSKGRQDKYYYLAREQGYRSRAAFKLIQLNKEFDFLSKSTTLLDLCAAPGGWLQVAAKYMPVSSLIVGVDLVQMKKIPRCKTIKSDITTKHCRQELKKHFKNYKIDVVLHDGSPNVGSAWVKDAYSQSELTLVATKLACEFLRVGGIYVTKVFRSQDYNSLLWVFHQFFEVVTATKPRASRTTSAEIYVICRGYKAPKKIDDRMFEPKYIFKEIEQEKNENILKMKFKKKTRNREGYEAGVPMSRTVKVSEFINSSEPIAIISKYHVLSFDDEESIRYAGHPATTQAIKALCKDLKRIGKYDFKLLLKWRKKILETEKLVKNLLLKEKAKNENENENEKLIEEIEDEDEDEGEDGDDEKEEESINKEIKEKLSFLELLDKRRVRRKKKKEKQMKVKYQERLAYGMITPADLFEINQDHQLFNLKTVENSQDFEKISKVKESEMNKQVGNINELYDEHFEEQDGNYTNSDSEEDITFKRDDDEETDMYKLEKGLDRMYNVYKENVMRRKKAKGLYDENSRLAKEYQPKVSQNFWEIEGMVGEEFEKEKSKLRSKSKQLSDNDELSKPVGESSDSDEEVQINPLVVSFDERGKASGTQRIKEKWFDNPLFDEIDSEDETEEILKLAQEYRDKKQKMDRKKLKEEQSKLQQISKEYEQIKSKNKKQQDVPSNIKFNKDSDSSDDESDRDQEKTSKKKDQEKKKKDKDNNDDEDDPNKISRIYLNPKDPKTQRALSLGPQLVNQKSKRKLIDESYNKFAFNDDDIPSWFNDEEAEHRIRTKPMDKDFIMDLQRRAMEINARPIKKVIEAKARKKRKQMLKLEQIRRRATSILENNDLNNYSKLRQIQKMYGRAKQKPKVNKIYIVSSKGGGKTTSGRKKKGFLNRVKSVDKRMKKDQRNARNNSKGNTKRNSRYKKRRK